MKVLHVTFGYYPSNNWGGIATVVDTLAAAQLDLGHDVSIVCANLEAKGRPVFENAGPFIRAQWNGVNCTYLHIFGAARGSGTVGPTALGVRALMRLRREVHAADIVHVHGGRNAVCMSALAFSIRAETRTVLQPHGGLGLVGAHPHLKRLVDIGLNRLIGVSKPALASLSVSETAALQRRFPRLSVHQFENPVRNLEFLARQLDAVPTILFVGRLNRKKGPDTLVAAFSEIDAVLDCRLRFVGPDDGMLGTLKDLGAKAGLSDRISYAGAIGPDELARELASAAVIVHPARTDTFPMAILEGIASGIPSVVSSAVEAALALEPFCMVAEPTPKALAAAIVSLVTDRDAAEEFANDAAKRIVDRFSPLAIARAYTDMYESTEAS